MKDEERLYEQVPYEFKPEEIRVMGEALARENQNIIDLRDQKSAAMASINAAMKEASNRALELATKINNRYEMRPVEVVFLMDTPRPGMKAIARIENPDDVIRFEPMTTAEKQGTFGFDLDEGEGSERDGKR